MKMTKVFLAAASLAALPVAAQAQINAQPGIYVGAGGGLAWGIGSNANASTSTGFAFGGQIGYDFVGPRVELEVGYGQLPTNVNIPGTAITGKVGQLPTIANERQTLENQKNDVQALVQQKKYLEVQLKEARIQKERLTLREPEDAKVLKILAKQGEMVSANTPVILLESKRDYYDIYVSEKQAAHLTEGGTITGTTVATDKKVPGTIRFITQAPGFADLKNSREKGQSDLSSFQIRIYTQPDAGVRPGMTIEVSDAEFTKR